MIRHVSHTKQSKFTRPNQRSVYLDHDVQDVMNYVSNNYPLLPFSMIMNAAMRYWGKAVQENGGIDGNLQPLPK